MTESGIAEIWRKLSLLETHIINLIVPINNISNALSSPDIRNDLIKILKNPLQIDERTFRQCADGFMKEFRGTADFIKKEMEEFRKATETLDIAQTFSEIKFIGKRLNQIEMDIKGMREEGVKKNIKLDFHVDGYQLIKEFESVKLDSDLPKLDDDNMIRALLSRFPNRDANIFLHRIGLLEYKAHTYVQIGKMFKLSANRCRDITEKIGRSLKRPNRFHETDMVENVRFREFLGLEPK